MCFLLIIYEDKDICSKAPKTENNIFVCKAPLHCPNLAFSIVPTQCLIKYGKCQLTSTFLPTCGEAVTFGNSP